MTNESEAHPAPVVVATFGSVEAAEVAQAKLRAFGVESALVDDDSGAVIPADTDSGIELAVRAADAETARDVLSDA
ncbi:MAG: hypothetical protein WBP59_17490 [Ilumatobacteraceae bacterium]